MLLKKNFNCYEAQKESLGNGSFWIVTLGSTLGHVHVEYLTRKTRDVIYKALEHLFRDEVKGNSNCRLQLR